MMKELTGSINMEDFYQNTTLVDLPDDLLLPLLPRLRAMKAGYDQTAIDGRSFREVASLWRQETRILSSIQAKIFNPHYQRIIGMGPAALSFIFTELKERGGYWYWALECITGENPAHQAESISLAKAAWLEYAVARGYLKES